MTAIETYPAACDRSVKLRALRERFTRLRHVDLDDALTCALVEYLMTAEPECLARPTADVPPSEGWIWLPADAMAAAMQEHR